MLVAETFDQQYRVDPSTGCHVWRRGKGSHGYGELTVNGKKILAHRYGYQRKYGPIAPGLQACHKCDNKLCVNPDHIFPGTDRENKQDALAKGKGRRGIHRGEANKKAKLTSADVRRIRRRLATGEQQIAIARDYGLHKTNVSCIARGITWRHLA